jgi:hypothetical protein
MLVKEALARCLANSRFHSGFLLFTRDATEHRLTFRQRRPIYAAPQQSTAEGRWILPETCAAPAKTRATETMK